MKRMKFAWMAAGLLLASFTFLSCDDDNDGYVPAPFANALVTMKTAGDQFYLQLDDHTTLYPVNMKASPYGDKEVRALASLYEVEADGHGYTKAVHVNWIDSILTKTMAPWLGVEENVEVYGDDPVEIVKDWVTIAEDGYLTLRFRTVWGSSGKPHYVNLVQNEEVNSPYALKFCHNAYGDTSGRWGDGLVAFRLDQLPDTGGKTVKLILTWNSFSGEKSAEFDYCTRKATTPEASLLDAGTDLTNSALQ